VYVKNESERPLGNFKSLGGMIAGLRALASATGVSVRELLSERHASPSFPRLICASEGNHGLAVAAAAARTGSEASVYLPLHVSAARMRRIEAKGATIVRIDGTYDDAVAAASAAAARGDGILIPDTSEDPNDPVVNDVMAGYGVITREIVAQSREYERPSHVFVQAGVGGLAAAVADGLAAIMREPRRIMVVEPAAAPCVARALKVGYGERIAGELQTSAEMLACGLASARAVEILRRYDARSVLASEDELQRAVAMLRDAGGPHTTASGAAGVAGLLQVAAHSPTRAEHQLTTNSAVILIVTEGAAA
jgi:diaminopropionate ammonia-lyase